MTKAQHSVLNAIKTFIRYHGYSPTIYELKQRTNLKSNSTVHQHLDSLKREGYIDREYYQQRSIKLSKNTCPYCNNKTDD